MPGFARHRELQAQGSSRSERVSLLVSESEGCFSDNMLAAPAERQTARERVLTGFIS
jgi:hypothetical protein